MSKSYREGGHTGPYKFSRRYTTRKVRRASRDFCNQIKVDFDLDEGSDLEQEPNDHTDFKRGWKPLYRWLESHVDEKWDDVYSELSTKIKTVFGKDEHVKSIINSIVDFHPSEDEKETWYRHEFYVDDQGVLNRKKRVTRRTYYSYRKFDVKKLTDFLNGRIIGRYNGVYYWFTPTSKLRSKQEEYKCIWFKTEPEDYYAIPWNGRYIRYVKKEYSLIDDGFNKRWKWDWVDIAGYGETINTRRLDPLTDEEINWFKGLPGYYQEEILKWSPSNCE